MQMDLKLVPFSRRGSYMAFSHVPEPRAKPGGLYLRTVRATGTNREAFRVELTVDGQPVGFEESASPERLRLQAGPGFAEFCFSDPGVVRGRAEGVGVRLSTSAEAPHDVVFSVGGGVWIVNDPWIPCQFALTPLAGRLVMDAPWTGTHSARAVAEFLPAEGAGVVEFAVEDFDGTWRPREHPEPFEACVASARQDFDEWLSGQASVPEEFADARELAAYVNWSCVVGALGRLRRPAMVMSKNWMTNIWSWDHCFNAWALAYGHPDAAWDQFMVLFDLQDETGLIPDSVNHSQVSWAFTKPPVHGWVLRRIMERTDQIDRARLDEVYGPLSRWTDWWLACRDFDRSGLPQYCHGNDSGWDNATVFLASPPVKGPDLAAYLVVQMDVLTDIAASLDRGDEARAWKSRADELLGKLLGELWRGETFVVPSVADGNAGKAAGSDSLLVYLPIVLGERLPQAVRAKMIAALKDEGRFLTAHGLATESPKSSFYQADGYWRGPIWAPSTLVTIDGLAQLGETALARRLARGFCEMCEREGFAENFDALTGAGLRDRAYTWTSSVFLILAHEYL